MSLLFVGVKQLVHVAVLGVAFVIPSHPLAQAASPHDAVARAYECHGTGGRDTTYKIRLDTVAVADGVYHLTWTEPSGNTAVGYGFLDGQRLVAFAVYPSSGHSSVVSYVVKAGHLDGRWVFATWEGTPDWRIDGTVYSETCRPAGDPA